jgi:hypothetical protein
MGAKSISSDNVSLFAVYRERAPTNALENHIHSNLFEARQEIDTQKFSIVESTVKLMSSVDLLNAREIVGITGK